MATESAIQTTTTRTVPVTGRGTRPTAWTYRPAVDVFDTPDAVLLQADLPGARPEGLDVSLESGILTIAGAVEPRHASGEQSIVHEYGVGSFHRRFEVDETIDAEHIKADYRAGVLSVTLPKSQHARRRRIPVTG